MISTILSLALSLAPSSTTATSAPLTPQYIIECIEKDDEVDKTTIGSFLMGLGSIFTDTWGVNSVNVYKLGECSEATQKTYLKNIKALNGSNYHGVITTCDEDEYTKVLFNMKGEYVTEMYVMSSGSEEPVLVKITGEISLSDLPAMMEDQGASMREKE